MSWGHGIGPRWYQIYSRRLQMGLQQGSWQVVWSKRWQM